MAATEIQVDKFDIMGTVVYTIKVSDATGHYHGGSTSLKTQNKEEADLHFTLMKAKYPDYAIANKSDLTGNAHIPPGAVEDPSKAVPQEIPDEPQDSTSTEEDKAKKAETKKAVEDTQDNKNKKKEKGAQSIAPPPNKFYKKSIDRTGIDEKAASLMGKVSAKDKVEAGLDGLMGEGSLQASSQRIVAKGEEVMQGKMGNSFIVMGRDRPASRASGYGGKGDTHCDQIDIVAGLGGANPVTKDKDGQPLVTDPNFQRDAARILLSQKTDIDKNFQLCEGTAGCPEGKSAIGIKADGVRVMAREGIKLVTNADPVNSQGGESMSVGNIDLIAGNDDSDLQPLVKGHNLKKGVEELLRHISDLTKVVHGFMKYQMKMNQAVSTHTHLSPFYGIPTAPSEQCMQSGFQCNLELTTKTETSVLTLLTNLVGYDANYLKPTGPRFICSQYNNTN
tara:strand:- start:3892 stop:5238 length:1347 start_codon:yes stop_codon:yes gene_type:complete